MKRDRAVIEKKSKKLISSALGVANSDYYVNKHLVWVYTFLGFFSFFRLCKGIAHQQSKKLTYWAKCEKQPGKSGITKNGETKTIRRDVPADSKIDQGFPSDMEFMPVQAQLY